MASDKAHTIKNTSNFEKDLGRHLKDLMSTKEADVTHSLLEQLITEVKQTKNINHLGIDKVVTIFDELLHQQKVLIEKIQEQNLLVVTGILPELQKATFLLDALANAGEGLGIVKRDHCSSTDENPGIAGSSSKQQLIPNLRRYDPILASKESRLEKAKCLRKP